METIIHFSSGQIILKKQENANLDSHQQVIDCHQLSKEFIFFDMNKQLATKTIYVADPVNFLQDVDDSVQLIEAAGGFVVNPSHEALVIYRRGKWDLPKGKIDKGESIEEAAIREVEEECGIKDLVISKKLLVTYHCYQLKQQFVLKKTHWFWMDSNFAGTLVPQQEEGIWKAEWRSNTEIEDLFTNTYPSILEVLHAARQAGF